MIPLRDGRWLTSARIVWLGLVILAISLWAIGSIENTSAIPANCSKVVCDPFALSAGDLEILAGLKLPIPITIAFFKITNVGLAIAFFAIGGSIARRKSDDGMGLLVSFALVYLGAAMFTDSDDALWRAYPLSRAPLAFLGMVGYGSIMLLLFHFPDGRFVPQGRAIRRLGWFIVLLTMPFVGTATRVGAVGALPLAATISLGLVAQIYRYFKVSRPLQRQQTKWIVIGLGTSLAIMLLWLFTAANFPPGIASRERIYLLLITRPLITVLIPLLPLTIAFSILRYRLWDIDSLINRTLVYTSVTAVLAGVYLVSVVLLQRLLMVASRQASPVSIVISTLVSAALFSPLRGRVQDFIDRRFYRRKYDAEKALATFARTTRDEADLDRLRAELTRVVQMTVQPESMSLWLRQPEPNDWEAQSQEEPAFHDEATISV